MRGNILIVEDESGTAKAMEVCLRQAGYTVRISASAEAALLLVRDRRPDLILLDHQLPAMTGLDLLGHLKQSDPELKIVMLTGRGSVDMAVEAMRRGASDFLTKPVDFNQLRVLVARLLGHDTGVASRPASGFAAHLPQVVQNNVRRLLDGCAAFRSFALGDHGHHGSVR